jgi:hypothetical protein
LVKDLVRKRFLVLVVKRVLQGLEERQGRQEVWGMGESFEETPLLASVGLKKKKKRASVN